MLAETLENAKENGPETLLAQRPALTETSDRSARMANRQLPPLDYLRQSLRYEPDTGKFYWLERPLWMFADERIWKSWNTRMAGKEAVTAADGHGYARTNLAGQMLSAHRLAWFLGHGEHPDKEIDHINGDPSDNRLENLRHVTHAENSRNRKLNRDNRTEYHGVSRSEATGFWHAEITHEQRETFLGSFLTREEAIACRKGAERALGFHENHGRQSRASTPTPPASSDGTTTGLTST